MTDQELWHVQLGGVVRTMTLDELDNAFQAGVITERTMVLKSGTIHWTTLADIAGISEVDEQPNSIAPMATDIAVSSQLVIPRMDPPNFDLEFGTDFGTEERAIFKPKRRIGRAVAAVTLVAALGGGLFAVKSYGISNLKAKASQVASLVKHRSSSADGVSATGAMQAPPAVMNLPATPGTSMNSLPAVGALGATNPPPPPPDPNAKKKVDKKGAKNAAPSSKKANANDPTTKGAGQFDPLNGKL